MLVKIAAHPFDTRLTARRFGATVVTLVVIGFLAVLAAGISAGLVTLRGQQSTDLVDHTFQVERNVSAIRLSLEQMRSRRRGYLLRLGPGMREDYANAAVALRQGIAKVESLTRDNPVQQQRVAALKMSAARLDDLMTGSMRAGADGRPAAEAVRLAAGTRVESLALAMLEDERRLLLLRQTAQRATVRMFFVILGVAAVLLLLVAGGSVWIIRRYTRDLAESRDALRGLNENLEAAVQERTVDLQRANDEIQRFAYIVSHDLRSPLVNVMGFTAELEAATKSFAALIDSVERTAPEIVTADAKLAAREDLPEAIGFIRSSTQKMDRLINAILRLSREGRRTVMPERIDMNALAQSVADSLKHRTDEQGTVIEIARPLPAVTSDRLAVEQILSNLVENAVKYLKPGRPGVIRVSGRRQGKRVIYKVEDNGRGIDPRDHDRVFDLFRRSGQQDQPGEGIGLAHVRAQAYRIGGTVGVTSTLGEGATFTVNLPVSFAGDKGATS